MSNKPSKKQLKIKWLAAYAECVGEKKFYDTLDALMKIIII